MISKLMSSFCGCGIPCGSAGKYGSPLAAGLFAQSEQSEAGGISQENLMQVAGHHGHSLGARIGSVRSKHMASWQPLHSMVDVANVLGERQYSRSHPLRWQTSLF